MDLPLCSVMSMTRTGAGGKRLSARTGSGFAKSAGGLSATHTLTATGNLAGFRLASGSGRASGLAMTIV